MAVGEASISQAKASVRQSEATLQKAKRNLAYCTIKSPVNGVIIDRRVNIGQTVVSSLNAPSLFLIAKDLRRMQVWVAVNEADIGKIYPGQPVTFTISTYEGQTFKGEVGKIRLNATMTQNVVTYTVEVVTDNSSGKLFPYLTANVNFELQPQRQRAAGRKCRPEMAAKAGAGCSGVSLGTGRKLRRPEQRCSQKSSIRTQIRRRHQITDRPAVGQTGRPGTPNQGSGRRER